MNQKREQRDSDLIAVCWADFCGHLRTRTIPRHRLKHVAKTGVGFPASGQALDLFGGIAPNRWGPSIDVRHVADLDTLISFRHDDTSPPVSLVLSDIRDRDGSEFSCCTRSFLKRTIDELEQKTGFRALATCEVEFMLRTDDFKPPLSMSIGAFIETEPFGSRLVATLEEIGISVESFEPEYGAGQYELSISPTDPLTAADQSMQVREIVRAVAKRCGYRATFTPKLTPDSVGNGLHIHISLQDKSGNAVFYDESRPYELSQVGSRWAAGIVSLTDTILAFSAPTVASYLRLGPSKWSSGFNAFGYDNREASLRICVSPEKDSAKRARSYNLEFRPADNTCNPYLVIGLLLRAGLYGIENKLEPPALVNVDSATLGEKERDEQGVTPLANSLLESLERLQKNETLRDWLPEELLETYLSVKKRELETMSEPSTKEMLQRYAALY